MTITMENQAVAPTHKWQGIASFIIGVTSIIITSLLVWIVLSKAAVPQHMVIALQVLSTGMLCANLIGIALGFRGTKDRSSRKLYPRLGLTVNVAIVMVFLVTALIGVFA